MTRRDRFAAVLMCSIVTGVFSCAHLASAAAGDAAKGKSIYKTKCVSCHGPQGKGDGPVGKKLKPPAADFTNAESKKKSSEEFQRIIENGVPKTSMVAWKKQLSEQDIQNVLAYVESLRK